MKRTTQKFLLLKLVILVSMGSRALAATYYVSTTGNNNNTCTQAQSLSTPKRTIAAGISCMSGGDTLRVRGGSYSESIPDAVVIPPGNGSWAAATKIFPYAGETVVQNGGWIFNGSSESWIILGDSSGTWIIDGAGGTSEMDGLFVWDSQVLTNRPHHIRWTNLEVKNWRRSGGAVGCLHPGVVDNLEIVNNTIHDCGVDQYDHGIYASVGSNMLIADNHIYNVSGYGIHFYNFGTAGLTNAVIKNNRVHDTGQTPNTTSFGILAGNGSGHKVYNNIVYNNGGGIALDYGTPSQIKVWNNTVYNNNKYSSVGITVSSNCSSCEVKNNIAYGHTLGNIVDRSGGAILSTNLTADPKFVDASGANFRLQSASPAISAGIILAEVTSDIDGISRLGLPYDIGAHKYASGTIQVLPPSNLRITSP